MARKNDIIDDDGNLIAPPPVDDPIMKILYLLEYGRKRGFRIGPTVQVGDTIIQVTDTRLKTPQEQREPEIQPGSDMALILQGQG